MTRSRLHYSPRRFMVIGTGLFLWQQCLSPLPAEDSFDSARLIEISRAIAGAIEEKKLPGAVFWVERQVNPWHFSSLDNAHGLRAVEPEPVEMTPDTIFDLASLTKVVATAPAIALLIERGRIDLDQPVSIHFPEFEGEGREGVTVRHLLTHTSGLRPGLPLRPPWEGHDHAIALACAETLVTEPGTTFRYSDINFILLGELVRRVSGVPLDEFTAREIFGPLDMKDTGFRPPGDKLDRIAPTQRTADGMLHGVVHDPTARAMGGVAGHAGLFSTAPDLAVYARMLLQKGKMEGFRRLFQEQTVSLMTSVQTPDHLPVRRALGWDVDSPFSRPRGQLFPIGSFGHTGWTGTCLWIDPHSGVFWMLLSNRVHPDGSGNVLDLQRRIGTLAAEVFTGIDYLNIPNAPVPLHPVEP